MIPISVALMFCASLTYSAFIKFLERKWPTRTAQEAPEDLRAEINRIKLMLNIKTFNGGEKK